MADVTISRSAGPWLTCRCASCESARAREGRTCATCGGNGTLLGATGELRPCSICSTEQFSAWAAQRLEPYR